MPYNRYSIFLCLGFSVLLHLQAVVLFMVDSGKKTSSLLVAVEYRPRSEVSEPRDLSKINKDFPKKFASHTHSFNTKYKSRPALIDGDIGNSELPEVLGTDLGIEARYPRLSRVLGEQGKITVEFSAHSNSQPETLKVLSSSGYSRLDQSAMDATRDALLKGLLADPLKDRQSLRVTFIFRLLDEKH